MITIIISIKVYLTCLIKVSFLVLGCLYLAKADLATVDFRFSRLERTLQFE